MESPRDARALRARWIVPVASPPLVDGVLTWAGHRVVAVGENRSAAPPVDLGDVAVLPAFVNPHTHLEFSGLEQPLGRPGQGFAAWIREVVTWRREWRATCRDEPAIAAARLRDVVHGLDECRRSGVRVVGDIATPGWPRESLDAFLRVQSDELPPAARHADWPQVTVFLELLGLSSAGSDALWGAAQQHLAHGSEPTAAWRPGWSPHAPYSVHVDLVRKVCAESASTRTPVAMHLAESLDELELLQSHSGPLVELLAEWGVWDPSAVPRGIRPGDYLNLLATAQRALVIHGNYLSAADWEILSRHRDRLSVVYCPRTHAYFGHAAYPLESMLQAGVQVAVGTDSRASNPDLNVLADLQFVRRRHPTLAARAILALGTRDAAASLGVADDWGTIAPGRWAEFVTVKLPAGGVDDVEEWLLTDPDVVGQCDHLTGLAGPVD